MSKQIVAKKEIPAYAGKTIKGFCPFSRIFFLVSVMSNQANLVATPPTIFYFWPHRQMSYFWGTGREPPIKRKLLCLKSNSPSPMAPYVP